MKTANSIFRILLFLSLIAVPMLLKLFLPEANTDELNAEKRTLAEFPEFSVENYNSFSEEFDAYLDDHLPFRDKMISTYSSLLYNVFSTSSNKNVIVGRDGWLFYDDKNDGDSMGCYRGETLFTQEELGMIAKNLTDAKNLLESEGRQFVLLIAPNKERLFYENMPDYIDRPADKYAAKQLVDYLKENTDVEVIYLYDDLFRAKTEEKPAPRDRELYYKGDTHWRHYAAYISSEILLKSLGKELPDHREIELYQADELHTDNDLSMLIHLEEAQSDPIYLIHRDQYNFGEPQEGNIFVIQDSFYNYMKGYVASRFDGHQSENGIYYDFPAQGARIRDFGADVVVYETVERFLPKLLGWGIQ